MSVPHPSSVPAHNFDFSFDPNSATFPPRPPLPPSADLFSTSETTDLFGFLDNVNFEIEADLFSGYPQGDSANIAHGVNTHFAQPLLPPAPFDSTAQYLPPAFTPTTPTEPALTPTSATTMTSSQPQFHVPRRSRSPSTTPRGSKPKALLSIPQKRLNHIMSEQKRRNAIRDGYAQLTTLLAPKGAPPGSGMPTRGRPKGSGARGKGRTKGKSGVLFRAVEYIHWLDEGLEALRVEVARVESLAGIHGR